MTPKPLAPCARRLTLALGALGVVFGDIGTSPLYTLSECLGHLGKGPFQPADVLGLLSLVVWSLTLVVSVKYLVFVMQADNRGEGGLFALLALLPGARSSGSTAMDAREDVRSPTGWTAVLVMVGAALLYGDGMITPTISVLSAMEGLKVASPALAPAVLPMTCGVLLGLFALQSRGPGAVGRLFGPVMVLWFLTLAGLGLWHVAHFPGVLDALNPMWAVRYFARHGLRGATILGAVVLAVTGGEALYADMGQFGRGPIRLAWFALAMPSLVLNYFGQGALILHEHTLGRTPFFGMVPPGGLTLALVVLSTAATVIASQALISGAFSMTHQAIQLGFLPRLRVKHTSQDEEGQVYVPAVNVTLAIACVLLALVFRESSRLAAAYGIAVTGTMVVTSLVYFEITRKRWKWSMWLSLTLLFLFLSFDVPFAVANLFKIRDGGYVPLLVGTAFFLIMATWHRGRAIYHEQLASSSSPFSTFFQTLDETHLVRTSGISIVLTSHAEGIPPVLAQLVRQVKALPETVLLVTVRVLHQPHVAEVSPLTDLGYGFYRLVMTCGYMDETNVPRALALAIERDGLRFDIEHATYFVARDTFIATSAGRMGRISEGFFALLARNTSSLSGYFFLPPHQVVEIGEQRDL
ncbi:MAG TPA: KUP/HAK/KT family potassium transporter [Polyangia bacterium]